MEKPLFINHHKIQGFVEIVLDSYVDTRGNNFEGFNPCYHSDETLNPLGCNIDFSIDSFSTSRRGVLRGFHGDSKTAKLIQCLYGKIEFAVIDVREGSPTKDNFLFFQVFSQTPRQFLVPAGCVNAHLCVSSECVFSYKLSDRYYPQNQQIHVKWDDPQYKIPWSIKKPILSERDK